MQSLDGGVRVPAETRAEKAKAPKTWRPSNIKKSEVLNVLDCPRDGGVSPWISTIAVPSMVPVMTNALRRDGRLVSSAPVQDRTPFPRICLGVDGQVYNFFLARPAPARCAIRGEAMRLVVNASRRGRRSRHRPITRRHRRV